MLPLEKATDLLGAGNDSKEALALKALCGNRALLIEVAKAAHNDLEIPLTPEAAVFESTAASLKGELEQGKKGKGTAGKPKKGATDSAAKEESPAGGDETKTENQSD